MHVVLCGDSIFDNRAYVKPDEPDVVAQLRQRLPAGAAASLLAVDGSVTADVPAQLGRLPADATHVFVSSGGNDALEHLDLLERAATGFAHVLSELAAVAEAFANRYGGMLARALDLGLPLGVCTVYRPRFDSGDLRRLEAFGLGAVSAEGHRVLQRNATAALTFFNDVILFEAARAGVPVVDLRVVCDEDADFANPIEPSAHGGDKISAVIAEVVAGHDFSRRLCTLYR